MTILPGLPDPTPLNNPNDRLSPRSKFAEAWFARLPAETRHAFDLDLLLKLLMSLNLYSDSSASPQQDQAPDGGLQILSDIERLQNHVLQELEDLDARIRTVFKTFGYRETEPIGTNDTPALFDQSNTT